MSDNNCPCVTKCSCKNRSAAISAIRLGYGIFLSLVVVAIAVCFAISCVNIYREGGSSPFSPESISKHFNTIAIPTYLSIAAVILGAIICIVMPEENPTLGKIYNPFVTLKSFRSRLDLSQCDTELASDIIGERKFRRKMRVLFAVLVCALLAGAILFALDFSRYTATDINSEVLGCVIISLPLSLAALLLIFSYSMITSASAARELDITKWAVSRCKSALYPKAENKNAKGCGAFLVVLRLAVFAVAIAFIILGINNGGMEQVLGKAVRICTECIGLG